MSDEEELVICPPPNVGVGRLAEAGGTLCDGVEHGLDVRRRTRDYTQNFACRRLLLERGPQLVIPRFQLFEQPHIFDRNDRLVSECLKQLNLFLGEGVCFRSPNYYASDTHAFTQQGYA